MQTHQKHSSNVSLSHYKTVAILDSNLTKEDIRAFYQKYEPYLKREEDYPFEFNTDLNDVL
jgi:hypothetical protein